MEAEIGKYYETPDYISHTDTRKGAMNNIYHYVRSYMPVSYTHLDVYKRQGITLSSPTVLSVSYYDSYDFLGKNGIPDDATTASVSYTHLPSVSSGVITTVFPLRE